MADRDIGDRLLAVNIDTAIYNEDGGEVEELSIAGLLKMIFNELHLIRQLMDVQDNL